MSTENNSSTDETTDQEQQQEQSQQDTGTETGQEEQQQTLTIDDSTQLPDTHPLVKTLSAQKAKLASQTQELTELRGKSKTITTLEQQLAERPSQEAVTALQARYDRLEAFLQSAGGPLGKALDSRTFTRELFETDKDIAAIVKDWNKANPSATSQALGAAAAAPAEKKADPNALIRAAAGR